MGCWPVGEKHMYLLDSVIPLQLSQQSTPQAYARPGHDWWKGSQSHSLHEIAFTLSRKASCIDTLTVGLT